MLSTIKNASMKSQMVFAIIFFASYFSPIFGILIYAFVRLRKMNRIHGNVALFGAFAALVMYALDYTIYMLS